MLHERDFAVLPVYKDTEIALYREREKRLDVLFVDVRTQPAYMCEQSR